MVTHLIGIVEDDPDQRRNYCDAIKLRNYRVKAYASREEALAGFIDECPDLVILDVMLGDDRDGGFHICQSLIQQYPELPIIFLTSRSEEIDQVFGLRLGAWDYQTKPVSLTILVERIAALLKVAATRSQQVQAPSSNNNLYLDSQRVVVTWKQQRVPLTVTECAMLEVIVSKAGGVANYDELAEVTRQTLVTNNTINTHVRHIRNKFLSLDPHFDALENIYGAGYRWRELS